ncbi:hypothetical protein [Streptomyces sp. CRN 30]|uniref:hypothetical protein n=1 Tax=Streptomyces sp. CRN 30 TaxID=3075613 RepID=UPI002A840CA1|nr:hypothetical protein [Streptomyces sp. CRN 30]
MSPMPRRPVRARSALLWPLLVLGWSAAACDIPATGVVEAGGPASGVRPAVPTTAPESTDAPIPRPPVVAPVPLYFVEDGTLVAVTRAEAGPADPATAVALLFEGPDRTERRRGLDTELPRGGAAPAVRTEGATVAIGLSAAAEPLSVTAVDQLACTAAAARLAQDPELGTTLVTVEQPDGRLAGRSSDDCPDVPGRAATAASRPSSAASGASPR